MATLIGTNIIDTIVPFDSRATFPTHDDFYGAGGYVALSRETPLAFLTGGAVIVSDFIQGITLERQKVGQVVYLPARDTHYQVVSTGTTFTDYQCTSPLPEAKGPTVHVGTGGRLKKVNPYEYSNSIVSTNIVAKNAGNIVSSNLGKILNLGPLVIQTQDEYQWSGILGGTDNYLGANFSTQGQKTGSIIVGGVSNSIINSNYGFIGTGIRNFVIGDYNTILGGRDNTFHPNISGSFVLGVSLTATKTNTVFVNNLKAEGHIEGRTKSFTIKHPTKKGMKLHYGSLESPYHGVRLTGKGIVKNGICVVRLPEYISALVHNNDFNIQVTNIGHSKVLYVDRVNLSNNNFTIKVGGILSKFREYKFYWSFTAIRKDVPNLVVED
jgi:hypothetical protein